MYLFKFEPILKQTLWGGDKINAYKHLQNNLHHVGESWELSGVPGHESVVANGELQGVLLPELIARYGAKLVGERNYVRFGTLFPLLVKFIDARLDLSIQVHPDDALAHARHGCPGKNEMWYVIATEEGARLCAGLSRPMDANEYEQRVADGSIEDVLCFHSLHPGDVFHIPAGRVHSIGAGTFLAEIQQTSDITYRIYDLRQDSFCIGSWLMTDNSSLNEVIEGEYLSKIFAFETTGFNKFHFDVRKNNKKVMRFHKLMGAKIVSEDEIDYFFECTKEDYLRNVRSYLHQS